MARNCAADSGYVAGTKVYRDLHDVWHKVGRPGSERIEKVVDFSELARDVSAGRAGRLLIQVAGSPKPKSYDFDQDGPGRSTASALDFSQGAPGRKQSQARRRQRLAAARAGRFQVPPAGNRPHKLGAHSATTRCLRDAGIYDVRRDKAGTRLTFGLTSYDAPARTHPPLVGLLGADGEPAALYAAAPRRLSRLDRPLPKPRLRRRPAARADGSLDGGSVRVHHGAKQAALSGAADGLALLEDHAKVLKTARSLTRAAEIGAQLLVSEHNEIRGALGVTYDTGPLSEGAVLDVMQRTHHIAAPAPHPGRSPEERLHAQAQALAEATAQVFEEIERELGFLRRTGRISPEERDRASCTAKAQVADLCRAAHHCLKDSKDVPRTVRLLECGPGAVLVARRAVTDALTHTKAT